MRVTSADEARKRAEMQSDIFTDRLHGFVQNWAPEDRYRRDKFQRQLMSLFVDAMRNQTAHMSFGLETYASSLWQEHSLRPLTVIMEAPKK